MNFLLGVGVGMVIAGILIASLIAAFARGFAFGLHEIEEEV